MYDPEPKFQSKVQPRVQSKVTVPSYIKESGQVGNWLFWNGAGDKLFDFSGEKNHGDVIGPKWVDGPYGWALDFDGSDDYIAVPDSPSLSFTDAITIIAWVNPDTDTSKQEIINADVADSGKWLIRLEDNGTFEYTLKDTGGSFHVLDQVGDYTADEGAFMLSLTYDGSTQKGYKNGGLVDSLSASFSIKEVTDMIQIGRHPNDIYYLDARLGWVLVYGDRALSEDEIKAIHEETKPLYVR